MPVLRHRQDACSTAQAGCLFYGTGKMPVLRHRQDACSTAQARCLFYGTGRMPVLRVRLIVTQGAPLGKWLGKIKFDAKIKKPGFGKKPGFWRAIISY